MYGTLCRVRLQYVYGTLCRVRLQYVYGALCRVRLQYVYGALCRVRLQYVYGALCRVRLTLHSEPYTYCQELDIIFSHISKQSVLHRVRVGRVLRRVSVTDHSLSQTFIESLHVIALLL